MCFKYIKNMQFNSQISKIYSHVNLFSENCTLKLQLSLQLDYFASFLELEYLDIGSQGFSMLGRFGFSNSALDNRILFPSQIGLWVPKVTQITFRRWFSWFVVSGLCFVWLVGFCQVLRTYVVLVFFLWQFEFSAAGSYCFCFVMESLTKHWSNMSLNDRDVVR